jgi:glycine cleavage system H protein
MLSSHKDKQSRVFNRPSRPRGGVLLVHALLLACLLIPAAACTSGVEQPNSAIPTSSSAVPSSAATTSSPTGTPATLPGGPPLTTVTVPPIGTGTGVTFTLAWQPPNGTSLPYLTFYNNMKYDNQWLWVKPEPDGTVRIGFTEYAAIAMGPIWSIDLPGPGTPIRRGFTFGFMQGEDTMDVNLTAPVSGTVLEVNREVLQDFSLVNRSPYDRGWLVTVRMSHPEDLDLLLTAAEYAGHSCPPCHCNN